jgi:hypothetical protein
MDLYLTHVPNVFHAEREGLILLGSKEFCTYWSVSERGAAWVTSVFLTSVTLLM